jgi:hypothetical protein
MKKLLPLFVLLFAMSDYGQTNPTVPASSPVDPDAMTFEQSQTLGNLMLQQIKSTTCGYSDGTSEECLSAHKVLSDLYIKVGRSPQLIRLLAAQAATKYDRLAEQTKSAAQASQIADQQNAALTRLLVLQNQRIVELLEQILKKK